MFGVNTARLRVAAVALALVGGAMSIPATPAAADWHHGYWHGGYWHGPGYWHTGYWHNGWYGGRFGWWWVAGGNWYWYNAPVYPYPATVSEVYVTPPATMPAPQAAPAPQMWYYCDNPAGYYPYVQSCSQPYRPVVPQASAAPSAPAVPGAAPPGAPGSTPGYAAPPPGTVPPPGSAPPPPGAPQ
jgi:hypothetical protein